MSKELVKLNTTSKIVDVFLRDSTTGLGKTGVSAAAMSGSRVRGNAANIPLSFAAGNIGDAYSSGKFAEAGDGWYKFHAPNGVYDTLGSSSMLFKCSGAIDTKLDFQVVAFDPDSVANLGLTGIPGSGTAGTPSQVRTELTPELNAILAFINRIALATFASTSFDGIPANTPLDELPLHVNVDNRLTDTQLEVASTVVYIGGNDLAGNWVVYRYNRADMVVTTARIADNPSRTDLAAAWTNRATLTYV